MFKVMKKTSITVLAAITMAGMLSAPAFAQQSNRNNNNDALVGGVVGSEIAGSGNGTEGAIAGALVGGLAGAAIADNGNNRGFNNRRSSGFNNGFSRNRSFNNGFSSNRSFNNSFSRNRGFNDYGYSRSYSGYSRSNSFGLSSRGRSNRGRRESSFRY